jgi:hypothetical protein
MYHINPQTGNPGVCKADPTNPQSTGCKYNKSAEEHYATKEDARGSYEHKQIKEIYGPALQKAKAQTIDNAKAREAAAAAAADREKRAVLRRFIELKWKHDLTEDETSELRHVENGFKKTMEGLSSEAREVFKSDVERMSPPVRGKYSSGDLKDSVSAPMSDQIRYQNLMERFADKPTPKRSH